MTFHRSASIKTVRPEAGLKLFVLTTVSAAALAVSAQAQTAQTAQAPVEEIVVTGTRVVRDGYEAPTPLTVVGVEQIQKMAPANIADYVNTLPQLAGSASPQTSRTSVSAGGAGLNTLNLRQLGGTRTLVLLDGQRSVGSQPTGLVDINTFPQQLISRVDVVTGGASAQYGSDAVAGVVNFILDKKFTGVKGEIQGGVTTYGDDRNWKLNMSAGVPFADGRGHLLLSGEAARVDGIEGTPRGWAKQGYHIILNPAYAIGNGQPFQIVVPRSSQSNQTPGGIITGGPLKGIAFGPGGTPYQFNYSSVIKDPWMSGGDWAANDVTSITNTLDPSETRQTAFARLAFDITDDINIYGQWNWAYDDSLSGTSEHFNPGDLTVKADNAFLPATVSAQMTALKLTTLPFGTMSADVPYLKARNTRLVRRYVAGAEGRIDLFGSAWTWDAYYQAGESGATKRFYDRFKSKLSLALDSVRNAQGIPVCRSTLTNPTNGCVPFNLFGVGVNGSAVINYISGWSFARETYREQVMAASITGNPFDNWAGPVSFATGVEHRVESGGGIQSASNAINDSYVGNQAPVVGRYNVTEGFVETVFPLMKDAAWGDALDLNAAARFTSYSTSGFVTTWKAGLTYQAIEDLRFRLTRSRDIRAPNRTELFAAGIFTGNLVNDPFHNNQPVNVQSLQIGNINLKPEKADTTGLGVVVQPRFFPGFSASVDYYDIKIGNAVGTVGRQEVPNRCYAGETAFCSALTFAPGSSDPNSGFLSQVIIQPTNFVVLRTRGVDYEASYRLDLESISNDWGGTLSLRALATNYLTLYSNNGTTVTQSVGANAGSGPPHWKYTFSATYDNDPVTVNLTGRGISSGVYNNTTIGCTSGCPPITATILTQDVNYLPGNFYWDAAITYKFAHMADNGYDAEAFFSIRNLANTDPAIVAQGTSGVAFSTPPCNASMYDCLGRTFKAGIRFKLGSAAPMKKAEAAPVAAAPAPPAPPPPPPPARPAPPAVPQKFLVFFDFDRSDVRPDASKIVTEAAEYAKKNGKAVIHVTGHTDRAGTDAYNLALSERRARAVQAELTKQGFTANQITISGKGESENLVPTGDGVREPQNRRVEIVMDP